LEKTVILLLNHDDLAEIVRIGDEGDAAAALAVVQRLLAPKARTALEGG
jgi:hypothetical protein